MALTLGAGKIRPEATQPTSKCDYPGGKERAGRESRKIPGRKVLIGLCKFADEHSEAKTIVEG